MRIELDASAVSRLIGGNTEIEIGIRQQIVDEFCRKNLKALLNDATFHRIGAEWRAQLKATVDAKIDELTEKRQNAMEETSLENQIAWDFRNVVERAAQKAVDEAVAKIIQYQSEHFARSIHVAVGKALDRRIEQEIETGIRARLAAAMNLGPSI